MANTYDGMKEAIKAGLFSTSKIFSEKDKQFNEQVKSGVWPSDTCDECIQVGHCHLDFGHHHLDCCLHCGNDERKASKWGYRGK